LILRKASEITPEKLTWLWDGVLAKGTLSLLAGNPGLGKSQASLSFAATISTGGKWPGSKQQAEVGNVFILSMEDRAEDTIVPRLQACGADLSRISILQDKERPFSLEKDIPGLQEAIEEIGSVRLIIIDPITAYLGKSDANNSGEVRRITTELAGLAQKYELCVLKPPQQEDRPTGRA
jgi:RecA-family ATPase